MKHVGPRHVSAWRWSSLRICTIPLIMSLLMQVCLSVGMSSKVILAVIARYLALHAALLLVKNVVAIEPVTVMTSAVSKTLVRLPARAPVPSSVAMKVPM